MAMDYIRSAYRVDMQFDEDGQIIVPVTWYFCEDGAADFPGPHLWGSARTWQEHQLPLLGLGERWDSKPVWVDGTRPFFAPGTGGFCGKPEWFTDGCPSDAPPIEYSAAGVPVCCPQPPCQPWFEASIGSRTLSTENPSLSWVNTVDLPSTSEWFDFASGSSVIASEGGGACAPGASDTSINIQLEPSGLSCICHLQSFDQDTNTGTYVWDPTLVGPPGFQLTWVNPPA